MTFSLSALTGPVLAVVLVRRMNRAQWGHLTVASSMISLLAVVTGLGLVAAVGQYAAGSMAAGGEQAGREVVRAGLRLSLVAAAAGAIGVIAVAMIFDSSGKLRPALEPLLLLSPAVVTAPFSGTFIGFLRAIYRPRWLALSTVASSLVSGSLIVAAVLITQPSAVAIAAVRSIGVVIAVILAGLGTAKWVGSRRTPRREANVVRKLTALGAAMLLTGVFAAALSELDIVILAAFRGTRAAGIYSPASAVADGIMTLPALIGTFYLPITAGLAATGNAAAIRSTYYAASRWNIAVCSPAFVVAVACPQSVLRLLFGQGYVSMATPLRILACGAIGSVVFGYNSLTLDSFGVAKLVAARQATCIAADALSCVVLVPRFGAVGAAAATAGAIILSNILCSIELWRRYLIYPWNHSTLFTALAALCATVVATVVAQGHSGALVPIVLSALIGGGATSCVALACGGSAERRRIVERMRCLPWRREVVANKGPGKPTRNGL